MGGKSYSMGEVSIFTVAISQSYRLGKLISLIITVFGGHALDSLTVVVSLYLFKLLTPETLEFTICDETLTNYRGPTPGKGNKIASSVQDISHFGKQERHRENMVHDLEHFCVWTARKQLYMFNSREWSSKKSSTLSCNRLFSVSTPKGQFFKRQNNTYALFHPVFSVSPSSANFKVIGYLSIELVKLTWIEILCLQVNPNVSQNVCFKGVAKELQRSVHHLYVFHPCRSHVGCPGWWQCQVRPKVDWY